MIGFRDVRTQTDVTAYAARLDRNYPARPEIIQHIIRQIAALKKPAPRIAELCIGPGVLAAAVQAALPDCRYVGVDFMPAFLDAASARFPANGRTSWIQADLTGDGWPALLAAATDPHGYDAIISLQSLHDVGNAHRIEDIYRHCNELLAPGGILINADLVVERDDEEMPDSGKLTIAHHLTLLDRAGYTDPHCSLRAAPFGCVTGVKQP